MMIVEAPWPQPTSATRAPASQLLDDAVERREPAAHQVLAVAGAEEDLGSGEETVVVFVPGQARAAPERLDQAVLVGEERRQDVVRTEQIELALLVGERDRLLRRERVAPGRRVVDHVAAGGLVTEPLAHHPRLRPAPLRKLVRRGGTAVSERAVEAEPRAEPNERRAEGGRQIHHGLPQERLEPGLIDRCRRHSDTS